MQVERYWQQCLVGIARALYLGDTYLPKSLKIFGRETALRRWSRDGNLQEESSPSSLPPNSSRGYYTRTFYPRIDPPVNIKVALEESVCKFYTDCMYYNHSDILHCAVNPTSKDCASCKDFMEEGVRGEG